MGTTAFIADAFRDVGKLFSVPNFQPVYDNHKPTIWSMVSTSINVLQAGRLQGFAQWWAFDCLRTKSHEWMHGLQGVAWIARTLCER